MIANFLEYFYTDKYDDRILLKNSVQCFSARTVKNIVNRKSKKLKEIKSNDIMLLADNTLNFIFNFLACIFSEKNIYISNQNKKTPFKDNIYLFDDASNETDIRYEYKIIKPDNIQIFFQTSGSTSKSKCIKKTLQNLINESNDLTKEFSFSSDLEFITTTTLNHLFGITFYLMLPLNIGGIINTDIISYPENIKQKNAVLVSTPSFLKQLHKYNYKLQDPLNMVISAGSKLETDIFNYAYSLVTDKVIDIYGSTETGIIAYRTVFDTSNLKVFKGIEIVEINEENTIIKSAYSANKAETLGDKVAQNGDFITLIGRQDNILKVQEKRVSATELESAINENPMVEESNCILLMDKVACLVALNSNGMEYVKNNSIPNLTKCLKNNLSESFEIIPQKWKYINALPKSQNGKINKEIIKNIFSLNVSLPLIIDELKKENEVIYTLYFYEHCSFFKGHFEGFPILPGVAQLYFATLFADWAFGVKCFGGQYKKIKFTNVIRPNIPVQLRLTKCANGIGYTYQMNDLIYSSGLLPYKNIYKEVL